MKHKEGSFKSVNQATLYYQAWLPEEEPKAVLMVVHGLAEHGGRYKNIVQHFVPLGYAIYAIDHFGHGKSEGPRVYVNRFNDYITPLKKFFDQVCQWQPGKPVFLVGHSLGGLIGAIYLIDHQADLAGAVLSAPAVKAADSISPALIFASRILSRLTPKAGVAVLDAAGISKDPAVVQAYVNDPLVYRGKITARLGAEMFAAMGRVAAEGQRITLPLIILQGSEDQLINPAGAQMLYDIVSSVDKTIKIYPGLYHEVFNEPERARVLGDLENWLESHRSVPS